ncbi:helicase [Tieghemostelium lacteum]|uniref:Helicase n=1 Tax=Tieghemostelium lacteum TaxID=361077 RepID=A0A151Z2M5_TIELA|nr:helicase [Tieghemostelium lacteum]|eukprot:KYQ88203.1 helicase [Tieghemostelium lacteum]
MDVVELDDVDLIDQNSNHINQDGKINFGKGWKSLNFTLEFEKIIEKQNLIEKSSNINKSGSKSSSSSSINTGLPIVVSSVLLKKKQSYFEKFKKLLILESIAEKSNFEKKLISTPLEKLQRNGLTLLNLSSTYCNKTMSDEYIIRFYIDANNSIDQFNQKNISSKSTTTKTIDVDCPILKVFQNNEYSKILLGDLVLISRENPLTDTEVYEATLVSFQKSEFLLSIKSTTLTEKSIRTLFSNSGSKWRIDVGNNKISMERMMLALIKVSSADLIYHTKLYDILLSQCKMGKTMNDSAMESYHTIKSFPIDYSQWKLNSTQRDIIEKCAQRRLSLVVGPPGTGKTYTAIHLIRLLVHLHRFSKTENVGHGNGQHFKILVTAYTNVGVDNIMEPLIQSGIRVLRIGVPSKIRSELEEHTLEYILEKRMARILSQHQKQKKTTHTPTALFNYQQKERQEIDSILQEYDVICTTCISSGREILSQQIFPIVLIDEASQATEPSLLIPLLKSSQQLIMFGDHNQLPPTVVSLEASKQGLSTSLFERLIIQDKVEALQLTNQYRMHSAISKFSSDEFYNGTIINAVDDQYRLPPKHYYPIQFIDLPNSKDQITHQSYYNSMEIQTVCDIVRDLTSSSSSSNRISPKRIGIISPYGAQSQKLNESLSDIKMFCSTVDSYQGREKDIIILSTVRSNSSHSIGFLSDWRRLNVSLTRAKSSLIIVGNSQTLSTDKHWLNLLKYLKLNNYYFINTIQPNNNTTTTTTTEHAVKNTKEKSKKRDINFIYKYEEVENYSAKEVILKKSKKNK